MTYMVAWVIEVEADDMTEAAKAARASQLREGTAATVFHVSLGAKTDKKLTEALEGCVMVDTETCVD